MLRCQPYRLQQQQHSRYCRQTTDKNSTESRLFVVVDHTWILGVALASFLLSVKVNVSMLFLRLLLLIVRHKRREEVGRLLVAPAPHSKRTHKYQDTQKTFAQRQSTFRKRHSLNRRTVHQSWQRCTEQPKTTHHLYNEQPRHQSKQANRT